MESGRKKTAVEVYISVVFRWGLTILVSACMCATLTFITFKLFGMYPDVSWVSVILFALMDIIFFVSAMFLIKTSYEGEYLKEGRLKTAKFFSAAILIIQWNCILYMIPSRTFWGFLFFFLILLAFFLDVKLVVVSGLICMVSLLIGWAVRKSAVMPVKDELFLTDVIMIVMALCLSLTGLTIFVFFMSHYLVNAKKDELEENNKVVQNVLKKVTEVTDRLGNASQTLVGTSQSESASTEELSAISKVLLEGSTSMLERSKQSKENLMLLEQSSSNMENKMKEVDGISNELVSISTANERSLGKLMEMSGEVESSTQKTQEVTEKLLRESGEIGQTLNIINEIAESINLLALNASIESARAGEAGRGFAVVAQEIGHLAESTKQTIEDVNKVVTRVQNGTSEVSQFMNRNAEQLMEQNNVIVETVEGIRKMMDLLKSSVAVINEADQIRISQNNVIGNTVEINEDIAERINTENAEFANISEMVQNSSQEIVTMTEQVEDINSMVQELETLLEG